MLEPLWRWVRRKESTDEHGYGELFVLWFSDFDYVISYPVGRWKMLLRRSLFLLPSRGDLFFVELCALLVFFTAIAPRYFLAKPRQGAPNKTIKRQIMYAREKKINAERMKQSASKVRFFGHHPENGRIAGEMMMMPARTDRVMIVRSPLQQPSHHR